MSKCCEHGYPNCDCDLVGGDPDCQIQPTYQSLEQRYISLLTENQELKDIVREVRDAALFVDDDDMICFMEEVPISFELYERICKIVRPHE